MAHFVEDFGEKLLGKDGEVNTETALADLDAVGIYFSAHWCPPCRGFTPKLADFYKALKEAGKKFEIVFVTGDNDEASFKSYHGEMPWLALPYGHEKIEPLNSKYQVEGIPHLVILDGATGEVNTDDGRSVFMKPNYVEKFPFKPTPMSADVFGAEFLKGEGTVSVNDVLKDIDVLGIYFSAHWCPPCQQFTPKFADAYKKLKEAGKNFEVIFASSDKNEDAFKQYFSEMPWLALPYDKRDAKEDLATRYKCQGIPYLVFIDTKTWKTITTNGRGGVSSPSFIEDFPYHPKPLNDLSESMDGLMNGFSFICFNDFADPETQKANKDVILPIAKAHSELGKEDKYVGYWFTANGTSGIEPQMRPSFGLSGTPTDDNSKKPQMALLVFPKKKFWFPAEGKGDVTAENIQALIEDQKAGSLEAKTLTF